MSGILSQEEVDALLKALEDMPEIQKAIDESTSRYLDELGYEGLMKLTREAVAAEVVEAIEAAKNPAKNPAKEETLQDWLDVLL